MEGSWSSVKCLWHAPRDPDRCRGYLDAAYNRLNDRDGIINRKCVSDSYINSYLDCHGDGDTECNSPDGVLRGVRAFD